MISLDVTSAKFALAFKAGELPQVDPNDQVIQVRLSGVPIVARITPKAASPSSSTLAKLAGRSKGSLATIDGDIRAIVRGDRPPWICHLRS